MTGTVRLVGGTEHALPGLVRKLREASFEIEASPAIAQAALLVTLAHTPDPAIAAAEDFAKADGGDRLVVNIWHAAAGTGWEPSRRAATMAAFTRHAALAWANRNVRVNGLILAACPVAGSVTDDDIADTILALLRWRSMTGQIIHLGG